MDNQEIQEFQEYPVTREGLARPQTGEIMPGGQYVVAAVCEAAAMQGLHVPPSWLGIIGRHAKLLLDSGFEPPMVVAAAWMAVLRGQPTLTEYIAGDLALATAGVRMSRVEYESKVAMYAADKQARPSLLAEQRAKLEARRPHINHKEA